MSEGQPWNGGWRPEGPRRKGWCPGALRPMETGDGLLVRVRASGGRLTLDQAGRIAEAALACGNGAIGLSARANLQIRGATESTLPELHAWLHAAGLLDEDPEVERQRNIVVSPLSDLDPEAAFDLTPALAALEKRLASDATLRDLPAKFGFALDAGGGLTIAGVGADIRFEATRGAGSPSFLACLAGEDSLAAPCADADVGEVAARLARAFLALTGAGVSSPASDGEGTARRMRTLVERIGARAVFAEAGLRAEPQAPLLARGAGQGARTGEGSRLPLGVRTFGAATAVGVAAPFGAIEARRLAALLARAREAGARGLRLTPWRAFFVVGLLRQGAEAFAEDCARLGFILDPDDPRLRVVACPGAPACAHAQAPLHEDAARFAGLLPRGAGVALHLSGCAKGCARSKPTALTLVASGRGYDVVVSGRAGDIPARRDLPPAAVEALIASGEPFRARDCE